MNRLRLFVACAVAVSLASPARGEELRLQGLSISFPDYEVVRVLPGSSPSLRVLIAYRSTSDDRAHPPLTISLPCAKNEFFSGITERVIDGDSHQSWSTDALRTGLNQHGETYQVAVNATLGAYMPIYVSSRGYALRVHGTWPGHVDFCARDAGRVTLTWEGPHLEVELFFGSLEKVVKASTRSLGPPVQLPDWAFRQWRWRNDVENIPTYFDGTRSKAPFNSQIVEDILVSRAFGIPLGVYWIDRPWSTGAHGYDTFQFDPHRLPHAKAMLAWMQQQGIRPGLWLAPWLSGPLGKEAQRLGLALNEVSLPDGPITLLDFTNPGTTRFLGERLRPLAELGVAAYKLDRGDQDLPRSTTRRVFSGATEYEQVNDYPRSYQTSIFSIIDSVRHGDFALLSRATYAGSSRATAVWGGDIGANDLGLRATIIGMQRAALMGLPFFGSDTGGYVGKLDREVTARWIALSAFSPIMEVGPLDNRAFWDWPTESGSGRGTYDAELMAIYRFYSQLRERLLPLIIASARQVSRDGMPMIRPLRMLFPDDARFNDVWDEYMFGDSILVAPVWKKGARTRSVALPRGARWRDAWNPARVYDGGRPIVIEAPLYLIPLFVRADAPVDMPLLQRLYEESRSIVAEPPDMARLEAMEFSAQ